MRPVWSPRRWPSTEPATGLSTVLVEPDDRATMTFPGTIGVMTAADVPDALLERSSHVHTGGFFLQGGGDELGDILRRARRAGATTSLDPGADPDGPWDGGIRDLLGEIDYLMPNAAEACALAGTSDVEQAARTLAAAGPSVRRQVRRRRGARGVGRHRRPRPRAVGRA